MLETLDIVALSSLDNFNRILLYNPYSTDVHLEQIHTEGQFGYESETIEKKLIFRGLIIYTQKRRFLEKVGINPEDTIPYIGLFNTELGIKKKDKVWHIIKDIDNGEIVDIKRTYEVVDIRTFGDIRTGKKVYLLSPVRGNKL